MQLTAVKCCLTAISSVYSSAKIVCVQAFIDNEAKSFTSISDYDGTRSAKKNQWCCFVLNKNHKLQFGVPWIVKAIPIAHLEFSIFTHLHPVSIHIGIPIYHCRRDVISLFTSRTYTFQIPIMHCTPNPSFTFGSYTVHVNTPW